MMTGGVHTGTKIRPEAFQGPCSPPLRYQVGRNANPVSIQRESAAACLTMCRGGKDCMAMVNPVPAWRREMRQTCPTVANCATTQWDEFPQCEVPRND